MINDYEAMGETTVKTYNRGTSCHWQLFYYKS